MELRVLVPDRWRHYGTWREAETPRSNGYAYEVGRVRWPWVGPAQFYLHWYPRLDRVIRTFRPHVIDLWEEPWGLVSAHACRLRNKLLPEARVVSETEQNIDKVLPFPFERIRAFTLANADYAVGRSDEAVRVLRAKGYAGPAEVVPNGVDGQLFRPMDRASCRRDLGFSGFVAGYVGRLVEEKGLMDLLDALPHCPGTVTLVFVGSGPLLPDLTRRAAELNVTERVRFLPALPLAELPKVMNALDVFVLPSRTTERWKEQFGRVIIEAHACGTPVIGSSSGAIPDVVGVGGLVAGERDPLAIAASITKILDQPELRGQFAAAGRAQVVAKYTWESVAGRMAEIYRKVLTMPRAPAAGA